MKVEIFKNKKGRIVGEIVEPDSESNKFDGEYYFFFEKCYTNATDENIYVPEEEIYDSSQINGVPNGSINKIIQETLFELLKHLADEKSKNKKHE